MSNIYSVKDGKTYVDGAADILHDLNARPPVHNLDRLRAGLAARGYSVSEIDKITSGYTPDQV